jgi:hypothetical protein
METIVTKEIVKKIIELYPTKTNAELSEELGIDNYNLSMILVYLRRNGVKIPSKRKKGIESQVLDIIAELRNENYLEQYEKNN